MKRTLPKFYTEDQMRALACRPTPKTRQGARDRAILGLLFASGIRASELCAMLVADVHPDRIFVRQGKYNAQRWVPISDRCWRAIQRYLALHPARSAAPLFRSKNDRQLSRRHLHKIVTHYSRALRLTGGIHTTRHSAATMWVNRGMDLQAVRAMLGHAHITSTAIYVGVAVDQLVRKYQAALEDGPDAGGRR